jgi:tryptophan synthase alpha chain
MNDVTKLTSDRINKKFRQLAERIQCVLISYLVVGYPNMRARQNLVELLIKAGADIIELAVPFSDPTSDGTTIRRHIVTLVL